VGMGEKLSRSARYGYRAAAGHALRAFPAVLSMQSCTVRVDEQVKCAGLAQEISFSRA
jgi:hypothetical protein